MNIESFVVELDNLLTRAMSEKPQPLPRILYELDLHHARIAQLILAQERRDAIAEMTNGIVPPGKPPTRN